MSKDLIVSAFMDVQVPMLIVEQAGRILESNKAANALFGYDNAGINQPIQDLLPIMSPDDLCSADHLLSTNVATTQMNGSTRTGEPLSLALQTTTWCDPDKGRLYALMLRDAASEGASARSVLEELKRANTAITGARIGVFEYDPISGDIVVSDIWRDVLELTPTDNVDVQEEWRSRVHPDDLEGALEPVRRCVEGQLDRSSCEYRLRSRDGTRWRWMRTDVSIGQRDNKGKVLRLFGAQTDITKLKETEIELRRSAQQFKSAFENSPIGKAIISLDGRWLRVNKATCDFFGYSEDELLRTDFQTLTHPDDLENDLALLKQLVAGAIPSYEMEKRYFRANGAIMWGLLSVGIVRDGQGNPEHFVSQIIDITESRRLSELKSEFVATVSHELRTPLTSVLGSLTLLSDLEQEPFSENAKRLLYIAQANGNRLQALTDDILSFETFASKQIKFNLSPQNIVVLVGEASSINQEWADKYGVSIHVISEQPDLIGYVDAKRFHQVMANLLSNAAKFSDAGGRIEIFVTQLEKQICVTVKNIGTEIPVAFHSQLFKPFSQAESASTRKRGGTGLGLSISKQIVEQMGGEIGFQSTPSESTAFWFTVRMDDPTPTQVPQS